MQRLDRLLCVFLCLLTAGCIRTTEQIYADNNVAVYYHHTSYLLNVHGGHGDYELIVLERSFRHTRGYKPFYLQIPETNLILFVTESVADENRKQATIHLVDLQKRSIKDIPAFDSIIGRHIRFAEPGILEKVESFNGTNLIIVSEFLDSRVHHFINLKSGAYEKQEAIWDITKPQKVRILVGGKRD